MGVEALARAGCASEPERGIRLLPGEFADKSMKERLLPTAGLPWAADVPSSALRYFA